MSRRTCQQAARAPRLCSGLQAQRRWLGAAQSHTGGCSTAGPLCSAHLSSPPECRTTRLLKKITKHKQKLATAARDASPEPQGGGGGSLLFFSSLVVFSYSLDAVVAGFGWVTTVTAPPPRCTAAQAQCSEPAGCCVSRKRGDAALVWCANRCLCCRLQRVGDFVRVSSRSPLLLQGGWEKSRYCNPLGQRPTNPVTVLKY